VHIPELFSVGEAHSRLRNFCAQAVGFFEIFKIFRRAPRFIPGKRAEQDNQYQYHPQLGNERDPRKYAQKIQYCARPQHSPGQIVGAVPAGKERLKVFPNPHKTHS
jgi:hypothetical protein